MAKANSKAPTKAAGKVGAKAKVRAKTAARSLTSPDSGHTYRLRELLGEGGFGKVWRAESDAHEGTLCLKTTTDQASWHREAYMAELLSGHPHVVKVHETFPVFENNKVSYAVVMELADHGTLADVIEKGGAWPEARAISEISKLLGAVARLHGSGALHRDITPYNVFVCGESKVLKLGDFGITRHGPKKVVTADAFAPWFVDTRIRTDKQVHWDAREDLWQVAQVLGVMLTGKIAPLRFGEIRSVQCSAPLRAAIARATGDRTNRYESALAMLEALKAAAPKGAGAKGAVKAASVKAPAVTTLKGRHVVFTGKLSIERDEAAKLAKKAGAVVEKTVTKATDLLVVGQSKLWAAGDGGGKKLLAADAKGATRKIDRIDEATFLKLVGKKK